MDYSVNYPENSYAYTGAKFMSSTLDFAQVEYDASGVTANIDEWLGSKEELIDMLAKHPDWNPEILSVVKSVKHNYTRPAFDREAATGRLFDLILNKMSESPKMKYVRVMLDDAIQGKYGYCPGLFTRERITDKGHVDLIQNVFGFERMQEGMKASRLLQKLLNSWDSGLMEDSEIKRSYDKWTEAISESDVGYKLVLSVNPADYLLMSYGNSWTSCHIINPDIANGSGSYNGQFKAGTVSYMNDAHSVISYIVKEETPDSELPMTPKIFRQVLFLDTRRPAAFFSRLYPAIDDSGIKSLIRRTTEGVLSDIYGVDGEWGDREIEIRCDDDHHYADYAHFRNQCSASAHASVEEGVRIRMLAGKLPYCLSCGDEYMYDTGVLYCKSCGGYESYTCESCGTELDEEDVCWVGAYTYCCDCVRYCEHCNDTYFADDGYYLEGYGNVCPSCYDEIGARCARCDEDFRIDDMVLTQNEEFYCQRCAERCLTSCSSCGESIPLDDAVTAPDGSYYCEGCIDEVAPCCEACGEMHMAGELDEHGLCPYCAESSSGAELSA